MMQPTHAPSLPVIIEEMMNARLGIAIGPVSCTAVNHRSCAFDPGQIIHSDTLQMLWAECQTAGWLS